MDFPLSERNSPPEGGRVRSGRSLETPVRLPWRTGRAGDKQTYIYIYIYIICPCSESEPRLPGRRQAVGDRGEAPGDPFVHRAHGHPRPDASGPCVVLQRGRSDNPP